MHFLDCCSKICLQHRLPVVFEYIEKYITAFFDVKILHKMVVSLSESDMLNGAVVPHSLAGKLAHLHFQILKCCSPASLVQWKNTRSAN